MTLISIMLFEFENFDLLLTIRPNLVPKTIFFLTLVKRWKMNNEIIVSDNANKIF